MKRGAVLRMTAALAATCGVFLGLALGLRWHLLVSALLAVGVYAGLTLVLTPRPDAAALFFSKRSDGAELSAVMEQANQDLKQVRLSAGQITDVKTHEEAAGLAETGARIYHYLRRQPEKIPSAHRFLTYYLDTVGRILIQYVAYQEAELRTSEVMAFQRKVRALLPKLRAGFDEQLTELMASERFDAEADMKVMERLLTAEGPMTADEPQNTEEFQWKTRQSSWDC